MNEVTAVFKCSKCHMTTSKVVTEGAKYNCYCSTCHIRLDLVSAVGVVPKKGKWPVYTEDEAQLLMEQQLADNSRRSAQMEMRTESLGDFEPMQQVGQ